MSVSGFFALDGKKTRPGIGAVLRLPSSITEHVHPAFARLEPPNPSNAVHILEGGPQVPEQKAGLRYKETTNGPPFNQKSELFCNDPEEFSNVCQKKLLMMLKIDLLMNWKDKKLLDLISTRPEYKRTDRTLRKPLATPSGALRI